MPATILPFHRTTSAPGLPLDEFTEIDNALTLLTFSLERCADPDQVAPSPTQLAAIARHALGIQGQFQEVARRVLAFAGHAADPSEFQMGNPATERLQRAALFGEPLAQE